MYTHARARGGTLITSPSGPHHGWKWPRKNLAPAFSTTNFNDERRQHKLDAFCEYMTQHFVANNRPMEIAEWMLRHTLDTLGIVAFDFDFRSVQGHEDPTAPGNIFLHNVHLAMREYVLVSPLRPWRQYLGWLIPEVREARAAAVKLHSLVKEILAQYKANHAESLNDPSSEHSTSMLGRIITGPYPHDRARQSEMILLLVGGHDTSAYSMAWILYELAKNPEIQSKLAAQVHRVGVANAPKECDYLQYVIKEGMRLWPVAAQGGVRELLEVRELR